MAHIYVYSPAGAVRDKAAFKRGVERLRAQGHEVEIDPDALSSVQRFAGDDATRLAAIRRAAASGADVALISRGGYGLTRLLPDLPYKQLAKAIDRGTHFVGYSDFTALQMALLAKTGAITWGGPALCDSFGCEGEPDDIMQACFGDLLLGQGEGVGWRLPAEKAPPSLKPLSNATLWGGNLSLVRGLLGTPYLPAIAGGVLFLEDVNSHPYVIERDLTQLLHAGVLGAQKAVVLGAFTGYELFKHHDKGYNFKAVVAHLRSQLKKVPVLTGLPFGHVPTRVLLPVGAPVDMVLDGRNALMAWGHL